MQWVCLGFPPLLLVFMLALERIEQAITADRARPSGTRGHRVILRSARRTPAVRPAPSTAISTHNPHRVRPIDLGRSVRRMRAVAFHPRSRPNRYGQRNPPVGARRH